MFRVGLTLLTCAATFGQSPEIGDILRKQIQESRLGGMAAVVVRADGVVGAAWAGVKCDGQTTPIGSNDLFHLGSNTKAITATMIARVVESGKLSWSSTPLEAFPELKDKIRAEFKEITLEQLLSHYAGLAAYEDTDDKEFKRLPKFVGSAAEQRGQFAAWVLAQAPAVRPGTKPVYSNAGYAVAAAMAERVTGSPWEQLVSSQVLEPLGIHAIFGWPLTAGADQPWGHTETKKGIRPVDQSGQDSALPPYLMPAGGIAMTVTDYGKFLQANLRGLQSKDALFVHLHSAPMRDKYALGWGVQPIDGVPSSAHTGGAGSFYAVAALQPTRNVAVAVFTNSDGERSAAAANLTLKTLLKQFAQR